MPGICYHIRFANIVMKALNITDKEFVSKFLQGNLIPDMFDKAGKKATHMYKSYVYGFTVPNMEEIDKICMPKIDNPVVLGIYTHLYLDTRFIQEILVPSFIWDVENGIIKNPKTGYTATKEEFFGSKDSGLYATYTSINPLLLRDTNLDLNSIPTELAMSGIELFDTNRREKTWKEELDYYLSEHIPYTGEVLDYDFIALKFEEFAKDLAVLLKERLPNHSNTSGNSF